VTLADSGLGFLPILVLWGVLMIAGKIQQAAKKAQRGTPPAAPGSPPDKAPDPRLLSELHRAMEDLRRTEAAQSPRREPAFVPRVARPSAAVAAPVPTPVIERSAAFARLEEMKQAPATAGTAAPRTAAPGPLSRYADGTARSAMVLAEILARPRSESL
jgi:hypothetical protein